MLRPLVVLALVACKDAPPTAPVPTNQPAPVATPAPTPVATPTPPATPDPCIDEDGDGFGVECAAGPDCDDADPAVATLIIGFTDGDDDGVAASSTPIELCATTLPDGFADQPGDDCDDADPEGSAWITGYLDEDGDGAAASTTPVELCAAVLPDGYTDQPGDDCDDTDPAGSVLITGYPDEDGDGVATAAATQFCVDVLPVGFLDQAGDDCDDLVPEAWQSCGTCVDLDGDGALTGCDAYPTLAEDCDDADPNQFAQCGACVDLDRDLSFSGCDAYVTLAGPDCDDSDPTRHPGEPELADDGIDNDCDGAELSAQSPPSDARFVDPNDGACDDLGDGTPTTPYCSLGPAVRDPLGGPVFLAGGSVVIGGMGMDAHSLVGEVGLGLYGGYDPSDWSRAPDLHETVLDLSETQGFGLQVAIDRLVLEHVTFDGVQASSGAIGLSSQSDETFLQDVIWRGEASLPIVLYNHAMVRDSTLYGTANSTLITQSNGDLVVLRSRFEHTPSGSGGGSIQVDGDSLKVAHSEFITSHGASNLRPVVLVREGDIAVLNSSFLISWPFPGSGTAAAVHAEGDMIGHEVVLLNNAMRVDGGLVRFFHESAPTVDYASLTARNNLLYSAPGGNGHWSWRWTSGMQPEQYVTADDFNTCPCTDVRDNLDLPPRFLDASTGDLRIGAGSAMIDGGVDLTVAYQDWFELRTSMSSSRPQGGAWDVGAHELND